MECAPTAYRMPCLNEDTQSWAIANWSEGEAGSGNGLGRCYLGQSLWCLQMLTFSRNIPFRLKLLFKGNLPRVEIAL